MVRGFASPMTATVFALAVAACSPPSETPPVDQPPEPQATQLRDAIQAPQDKARAVEDTLQQAAEAQQRQVDAATE